MASRNVESHKSSISNGRANVVATICYAMVICFCLVPGLKIVSFVGLAIIFIIERKSEFVRFSAMQSLLLEVSNIVVNFIILLLASGTLGSVSTGFLAESGIQPLVIFGGFTVASIIVSIIITVVTIVVLVNTYEYKELYLPLLGKISRKVVYKSN